MSCAFSAISNVFCNDFDFSHVFCENVKKAVRFAEVFFENNNSYNLKRSHDRCSLLRWFWIAMKLLVVPTPTLSKIWTTITVANLDGEVRSTIAVSNPIEEINA